MPTQIKKSLNRKTLLWLIPLILASLLLTSLFFIKNNKQAFDELKIPENPLTQQLNEVIPFVEMTIPYLRSRSYESSLSSLNAVSSNNQYQTFLTSYNSDDLNINALLTKPQGEMPEGGWPAIVFIHGYIPPSTYKTQEKYVDYVNYLARNNYVVFKIDLRGHGDSEGEPTGAYYSGDYVIDVLNAIAALKSSDFVNPDKIGLWGHSMAGNLVLRTIAVDPNIPVGVVWAGAVFSYEDWLKYRINDNSYRPPQISSERQRRREELFNTHGEFNLDSPFWKLVSPTKFLNDFKTAIQLHHAVDDDVVDIGYSRDLNALLNQTNIPHEFYEYTSGGHNISGSSFTNAMRRTVEFYDRYLQN